jgi:hypothetical protein
VLILDEILRWAEPGRRLRPVREMALIARTGRPAATFGLGRKQAALWSDPSLILPPQFDRFAACLWWDRGLDQFGKV